MDGEILFLRRMENGREENDNGERMGGRKITLVGERKLNGSRWKVKDAKGGRR